MASIRCQKYPEPIPTVLSGVGITNHLLRFSWGSSKKVESQSAIIQRLKLVISQGADLSKILFNKTWKVCIWKLSVKGMNNFAIQQWRRLSKFTIESAQKRTGWVCSLPSTVLTCILLWKKTILKICITFCPCILCIRAQISALIAPQAQPWVGTFTMWMSIHQEK